MGATRVAERRRGSGRLHEVLELQTHESSFRVRATAETERGRSATGYRRRRRESDKRFAWEQLAGWVGFQSAENGGWRGAGRRALRSGHGRLCDGDATSGRRRHSEWQLFVEARMGYGDRQRRQPRAVEFDRGGEYYGRYDGLGEQHPRPFAKYLKEYGIVPQYTMLGKPSMNDVAKRRNRTLKDILAYSFNRVPSKAVAKTPYELWTRKKPSIRHLHVWGCLAEARPYRPNKRKFDSRTISYYFVGVQFLTSLWNQQDNNEVPEVQTQQPQEVPLRKFTREKRSAILDDYIVFLQEHQDDMGIMEDDPINFQQVLPSSNS
ncbi:retrotransposon protein, putative, Ty1-copia subclass, expressed [Cucumis melo var. makuwa]|uniref:Retrotransposon protein, putative, Ty1-copia subclass, expressed n=1 Tax=Cucumis melo var. makuwa TaxID=1194695 RepID=A0A5D3C9F5_CUCMM|nr:retrotransposon protein, putative, Ty1-copia subclass, expressed [Cucumis melo var. makuwa]